MNCFLLFFLMTPLFAVDTVDNDRMPEQTPKTIVFSPDLRIGPEGGDERRLWSGSDVSLAVTQAGHILVVDVGANRIIEFAKDGTFVRQIGRPGLGPSEFQGLKSLTILADGSSIAFENNNNFTTFTYFDSKMNFVREKTNPQNPALLAPTPSPDGKWLATMFVDMQGNSKQLNVRNGVISQDQEIQLVLTQAYSNKFNMERAGESAWWSEYLGDMFKIATKGATTMAWGPDGTLYSAVSNKYEITLWDQDRNKKMVVRRNYKPITQNEEMIAAMVEPVRDQVMSMMPPFLQDMVTNKVVQDAIERAEFSFRKPPVFGILPMEEGFFLVVHDHNPITGEATADLFDPNGKYLGQTELPKIRVNIFGGFFGSPARMVFKNGFAYATIPDEGGEFSAVRYRYQFQ